MREKHLLWIVLGIVALWFVNKSYPFTTSPFWPWNRMYRNIPDTTAVGSGYGSTNEDF